MNNIAEELIGSPWWAFVPGQRIYCHEQEKYGRIVGEGLCLGVFWDDEGYSSDFSTCHYVTPDLNDETTVLTVADCARAAVGHPLDVRQHQKGYWFMSNHKSLNIQFDTAVEAYADVVINTPLPQIDGIDWGDLG